MSDNPHDVFDAFLSYSRRNAGFATELESALENYRMPNIEGIPKRSFRVFRDTDDLVGSEYYAAINEALGNSTKLIVLCSPEAAKSEFVNDEIIRFLSRSSPDNIISILLDGIPNNEVKVGEEDLAAFPPALVDALEMPLAIAYKGFRVRKDKVNKAGYEGPWYTLLSSILGIPRDLLEQREKLKQARRRNFIGSIAAAVIVALSIATIYAFNQREIAERNSIEAMAQRDRALRGQSMFLADLASQENRENRFTNGALLALEALPASMTDPDRPYVAAAEVQLYAALPNLSDDTILDGHEERVTFGAFSPDGKRVITASYDGTARLWDAVSGRLELTLSGHTARVAHAAFSHDGSIVVTASHDSSSKLWNAHTGEEIFTYRLAQPGFRDSIYHASISVDGKRVALASSINGFTLWSTETGELVANPSSGGFSAHAKFDSSGRNIISTSRLSGVAQIWDGLTGDPIRQLVGHDGGHYYATFSPDGELAVTASADGTARIWIVAGGRQRHALRGHSGKVFHAEFDADGRRVVSASQDGTARVWSVDSGAMIALLSGHTDEVRHAAFSPDGRLIVTSSRDDSVKLWDSETGSLISTFAGHGEDVTHAVFSPDGRMILSTGGDTARLWSLSRSNDAITLSGALEPVSSAIFSPDGKVVVSGSGIRPTIEENSIDSTLRIWNASTGELINELHKYRGGVRSLQFTSDSRYLLALSLDSQQAVRLWDLSTGQSVLTMTGRISSTALSPDNSLIAIGRIEGPVELWSIPEARMLASLPGHRQTVTALAFSPDNSLLASASWDMTARVWDVAEARLDAEGAELAVFNEHMDWIRSLTFHPDGNRIATSSGNKTYFRESDDNTVRVWDARSGEQFYSVAHLDQVNHVQFSDDGQLLASASGFDSGDGVTGTKSLDNSVRIWDAATGESMLKLVGHSAPVVMSEFSPRADRIVSASEDGTARVWDMRSGETIAILGHDSRVNSARFDSDGLRIVTAAGYQYGESSDNTARIWQLQGDTQQLLDHARRKLGGTELSLALQERFALDQ